MIIPIHIDNTASPAASSLAPFTAAGGLLKEQHILWIHACAAGKGPYERICHSVYR